MSALLRKRTNSGRLVVPAFQLTFDGFRVAVFAFKEASDTYRPEGNLSRYGIASPSHDGSRQIPYGRTSQDSLSLSRWCRAGWRISCAASLRAQHIPLAVVPVPNPGAPGLQRCCRRNTFPFWAKRLNSPRPRARSQSPRHDRLRLQRRSQLTSVVARAPSSHVLDVSRTSDLDDSRNIIFCGSTDHFHAATS